MTSSIGSCAATARAVAPLSPVNMTSVSPSALSACNAAGRISPRDAGLYNDDQAGAWERITAFVHRHGTAETKIGTQLAHAGRKASSYWPFSGKVGSVPASEGGWDTVGPGTGAFDGYAPPSDAGTDPRFPEKGQYVEAFRPACASWVPIFVSAAP